MPGPLLLVYFMGKNQTILNLQCVFPRKMENKGTGPTFGDFVAILIDGLMQDNTVTRLHVEYKSTDSHLPLIKCDVLCLSEESQNIPCAKLKRRGANFYLSLVFPFMRNENSMPTL
jgi:hypothetical protein